LALEACTVLTLAQKLRTISFLLQYLLFLWYGATEYTQRKCLLNLNLQSREQKMEGKVVKRKGKGRKDEKYKEKEKKKQFWQGKEDEGGGNRGWGTG
jgi:hypothetical protein